MNKMQIGLNEYLAMREEVSCSCLNYQSEIHDHLTQEEFEFIRFVLAMDFIELGGMAEHGGFEV
ncbi:hypothetical protein [Vibrio sp. R78045]|uniref:hypothetical protein n=1 Tax=Vibrio sp. R78045 TaxID=3093868 RepID=UPI0036F337A6